MTGTSAESAPPRWLCDEMLARLARILRAAGYDTALAAPGTPDRALLESAGREGRVLLTRDRRLAAAAGHRGLLILQDEPEAQARHLARACGIAWSLARFTRCLIDNEHLREAAPAEIAALPAAARAGPGPFLACPACGRVYWPGSHVRRMLERLDRLDAATNARSPDRP
ncbi:Mut7-C RNAse domain-containing protein [Methylobacterium sp. ID0610]|uniref:Mut7-C RNAse domain-containing protein n=1 Tax=Methylobacterium carpenticola TaxID=3344827 RepID=UPI0036ACE122